VYWRRRLTRLEAGLYGAVAAALIAFMLHELLDLMELAERSAMERTVITVNSSLNTLEALELARGRPRSADPRKANPFELAKTWPSNFRGDSAGLTTAAAGSWVYDSERSEIIYLPRLSRRLQVEGGQEGLHFSLADAGGGRLRLVPVTRYRWE
jgi:hypothetical protein